MNNSSQLALYYLQTIPESYAGREVCPTELFAQHLTDAIQLTPTPECANQNLSHSVALLKPSQPVKVSLSKLRTLQSEQRIPIAMRLCRLMSSSLRFICDLCGSTLSAINTVSQTETSPKGQGQVQVQNSALIIP